MQGPSWYVLAVHKPNPLPAIREAFSKLNLAHALWQPSVSRTEISPTGVKTKKKSPLFPGYVFAHFEYTGNEVDLKLSEFQAGGLLYAPGALKPAAIDDVVIERIKSNELCSSQKALSEILFKCKDKVEVTYGPWIGFQGEVVQTSNYSITVEVYVFGRDTRIEVPYIYLKKNEDGQKEA